MIRRDYLERLIEQIAGVVAKALGLARADRPEEALAEIEHGYRSLGLSSLVLDRIDVSSLRAMGGDKLPALRLLVEADAEISAQSNAGDRARRRARLAARLASEGDA